MSEFEGATLTLVINNTDSYKMKAFCDEPKYKTWFDTAKQGERIRLTHMASIENSAFADRLLNAEDEEEPVELILTLDVDGEVVFVRRGCIERLNARYSFYDHVIYTSFSVSAEQSHES